MTTNELAELIKILEETPAAVREVAMGLTDGEARWKPSDNDFSVVENVCHLRDLEQDGYAARIGRILTEDQPFLPDLNGTLLAEERHYNIQELETALNDFTTARKGNLRIIESLSTEQLERSGVFENTGPITLHSLLRMMCQHDKAHLKELGGLRERLHQAAQSATGQNRLR